MLKLQEFSSDQTLNGENYEKENVALIINENKAKDLCQLQQRLGFKWKQHRKDYSNWDVAEI